MNTLLGFVPRILSFIGNGLGAAQDGLSALSDVSKDNPKQSGVYALILGWLGVDPDAISRVLGWIATFASFLGGV